MAPAGRNPSRTAVLIMRNLFARIIVAVIGIPLLLFMVRSGPWTCGALIIVLQILMLREWVSLARAREVSIFIPTTLMAAAGVDILIFSQGNRLGTAVAIAAMALFLGGEIFRSQRRPFASLGGSALFVVYVCVPLALWFGLAAGGAGGWFNPIGALIMLWLSTWACDTAAYFTGRAVGRHKLYPAASPNKTVEGFIGGVIGAGLIPLVVGMAGWASVTVIDIAAFVIAVGLIGQAGDLLESLMKREAGVKDASSLLPGHGGLLDRFDSLLLSTPIFYSYLLLTNA
jgi:phosphatidate cytidylyltransferase